MASGELGKPQLEGLKRILVHPEVQKRTPVILIHHPIHNPNVQHGMGNYLLYMTPGECPSAAMTSSAK